MSLSLFRRHPEGLEPLLIRILIPRRWSILPNTNWPLRDSPKKTFKSGRYGKIRVGSGKMFIRDISKRSKFSHVIDVNPAPNRLSMYALGAPPPFALLFPLRFEL